MSSHLPANRTIDSTRSPRAWTAAAPWKNPTSAGSKHRAHGHLVQRGEIGFLPEVDGVASQHPQGRPVLLEDAPVTAVVEEGVRCPHRRGYVLDRAGEQAGAVRAGPGGRLAGVGGGTAVAAMAPLGEWGEDNLQRIEAIP